MANLAKTLRNVLAVADSVTRDLQVDVVHHPWIGEDDTYGAPQYGTPTTRKALVEMKQRTLRGENGQDILQRAVVTFLRPISANGAEGRREPVDIRDKIVLPNGYSGPIKMIEGLENSFPDSPYFLEVILG